MGTVSARHRRRLWAVFGITSAILVMEIVGGLVANSLALLADAGHVLADVFGLGLTLTAIHLAARPASGGRTFGVARYEILAAAVNAVLLLLVAVLVLVEAARRLARPPEVTTGVMLIVAAVALAANAGSLWLLRRGRAESLNVRAAFLEVLGDLLGAAAVIVAGVIIILTGYQRADAIASALIALIILPRTWRLLQEAVDVLLEATPKGMDMEEVRRHIVEMRGVIDVHDLHAWTITSGMNVVSAHVVVEPGADTHDVLDRLNQCLAGDFDVEHSTFQLESSDQQRLEEASHP